MPALLTQTSKMPCKSWSIPASSCKMGSKLSKREGTVCHKCYARKGFYRMPGTSKAQAWRLDQWKKNRSSWVESMVSALLASRGKEASKGYFRWFDSGDVQGQPMLNDIIEVCRRTPKIKHRLPTKEYELVSGLRKDQLPPNLTIQVSLPRIDVLYPKEFHGFPTCGVTTDPSKATCPAHTQGNKCRECRKCWDPATAGVVYLLH